MRTPLLLALAATALVGCASDRPLASTDWCAADLARHGVAVTARGTRLALRPAAPTPLLQRASLSRQAGSAVLTCRPKDGALTRCVVLYEDPGGQGFGKLALGYADRVIYPSDVDDGVTAEVRFRFNSAPRAAGTCS